MIERRENEKAEREWKTSITDFAAKHAASVDWEESIPNRGLDAPFSIDVSRALVRSNGQPVLVVMDLADVIEKDGNYLATFETLVDLADHSFEFRVELECTEAQANRFLDGSDSNVSSYAIVARINRISRAKLELRAEGDESGLAVVSGYSPDVFFADGRCIDALAKERVRSNKAVSNRKKH